MFSDVGRLIGTTSCVLLSKAPWVPFGVVTVCALVTAAVTMPLYALAALIAETCKSLATSLLPLFSSSSLSTPHSMTTLFTSISQATFDPHRLSDANLHTITNTVNSVGMNSNSTVHKGLLGGALLRGDAYPPASPGRCSDLVGALVPTEIPELLFTLLFAVVTAWLLTLLLCSLKFLASHAVCHQLAGDEPLGGPEQKASLQGAVYVKHGTLHYCVILFYASSWHVIVHDF